MRDRIKPKKGQESVWDYPRPPKLESTSKELIVELNGQIIARTNHAYRVLETSHPPTYYFPPSDLKLEFFKVRAGQRSFCEWKGSASYWDVQVGERLVPSMAWSYTNPSAAFAPIKDYLSFYASKADACYVDGELVNAQAGDFYGGWITSDIVGPFKGGQGTWGW
ncbi:MAG: DUF427 domain-containing protein [Bacteroidota bacterium]